MSLMKKLAKVVKNDILKRKASAELTLVNSVGGESYVLSGSEGTIGRKGTVQISKDWGTVSREHLHYYVNNGVYYVEDLSSSSGTKINGQEMTLGNSYEIKSGDKISMGGVPFRIE
jgi:hypothetical protein